MINFFKQLLDFLYQKKCYLCKKSRENLDVCSGCFEKLIKEELNPSWNVEIKDGVQFYYAGYYSGNLQKLIRAIKYHNKREISLYLAKFTYEYWQRFDIAQKKFTVIPVPLYKDREKKRRYNHMELVANEFANIAGYEVNTTLLKRIKNTKPQYGLKYYERIENMKNAFEVLRENYNGESLLIFDDIYTTGSTVGEIIDTLKKNEITDVTVLTITAHLSHK